MQTRELTGRERQAIRRSIKSICANYDNEYGCLPLDSDCIIFDIAYSGDIICKWFRDAVMPQVPEIERILTDSTASETKLCAVCGKKFPLNRRQKYCSEKCSLKSRRKSVAGNVKEYRRRKRYGCNHLTITNPAISKGSSTKTIKDSINHREGI